MSVYFLCRKVTAVQTVPTKNNPPPSDCMPALPVGSTPSPSQAFELIVNGIGSVSATAQVYASADDDSTADEWAPYGDPITVLGIVVNDVRIIALAAGSQPFRHFTAIVTAISGTNASADVKMSA